MIRSTAVQYPYLSEKTEMTKRTFIDKGSQKILPVHIMMINKTNGQIILS